jgi:hypothetical protein
MRKLFLLAAFVGLCSILKAQDFKKVQTASIIGRIEDAKTELDKLASDSKAQAKPEFWMWKYKIYAGLYKDDKLRSKFPGSEGVADEAFKKYLELDPSIKILKDNDGQTAVFDMYTTSFSQGIRTFNTKKWDSSLYYFNYSITYSDFIFKNKWSSSAMAFDTTSILYAGYSAQNAQKIPVATAFYERLADSKVGGEAYEDIYKFILVSNSDKKDSTGFFKYYAIAQQLYPKNNWFEYEVDFISKFYTLDGKTALYDRDDASGALTAIKYLHFGDMFVNLTKDEKESLKNDKAKLAFYQSKGRDAFKKAFYKDGSNSIAAFNAGVIHYNEFNILDDSVRTLIKSLQDINSSKPQEKDPKKKAAIDAKYKEKTDPIKKEIAALDAPSMTAVDSSITWLEKSFNILKDKHPRTNTEKSSYIKAIDFLANLYSYKRDKLRGKDPKAMDAMDAKFKYYDNMHDQADKER